MLWTQNFWLKMKNIYYYHNMLVWWIYVGLNNIFYNYPNKKNLSRRMLVYMVINLKDGEKVV